MSILLKPPCAVSSVILAILSIKSKPIGHHWRNIRIIINLLIIIICSILHYFLLARYPAMYLPYGQESVYAVGLLEYILLPSNNNDQPIFTSKCTSGCIPLLLVPKNYVASELHYAVSTFKPYKIDNNSSALEFTSCNLILCYIYIHRYLEN